MSPTGMPDALAALLCPQLRELQTYRVPAQTHGTIKLDSNESPFHLPEEVAGALAAELARVSLNRYPTGDCHDLRPLIAAELGVAPGELVFGNGSGELITFLISVFRRPRAQMSAPSVLYPVPSFAFYRSAVLGSGADPLEVALGAEFVLERAALDQAIADRRPNLAFFARPNNPTGTQWSREVIAGFAADNPDIVVVIDEAYIDYAADSMIDLIHQHANLVLMRTLSKLGLAALRIGYVHASQEICDQLEKVRPPYNVGSLSQHAAVWMLTNQRELLRARCAQIVEERERLRASLVSFRALHVFESSANLLLARVGTAGDGRAKHVWEQLRQRGVMVRYFADPGLLSSCIRISVGTPEENQRLVDALTEILA